MSWQFIPPTQPPDVGPPPVSADEYPIGTRAVDALGNTWKVWIDNRNGHVWVKDEEAI